MSHDIYFEQKERDRKEALKSQNAVSYARLCSELGVEPEDQFLYEHGEAILSNARKTISNLESAVKDRKSRKKNSSAKYASFLLRAYELAPRNFEANYERKMELLQEFFPGRFGDNGRQNISGYTTRKLGALFSIMVSDAEERVF